jgi:hypothetical protein
MSRHRGHAGRGQQFALRADIDIAFLIEREVVPAQRAVLAPGLVDNRNVWGDVLLIDDPIERLCRALGRVGSNVLRLEIETLLSPLDHHLRRMDLGLPNGARSFYVNDDPELDINEVIFGIGEERWPSAPDIANAILSGRHPPKLTARPEQRRCLGFASAF